MSERELVRHYASILKANGYWVVEEYNIYGGLMKESSFRYRYGRDYKELKHPPHLGQPTIDLLFGPFRNNEPCTPIYACEFKYLRSSRRLSYYVGLDEALALLTYGVDKAKLVHFIDERVLLEDERVKAYPIFTAVLIKWLSLPIGFEAYTVDRRGGLNEISEYRIEAPQNPILMEGLVRETREFTIKDLNLRQY